MAWSLQFFFFFFPLELGVLFRLVGQSVSDEQLNKLISDVDADKNGQVDFDEFVQMIEMEKRIHQEHELIHYFNVFDSDNKGYISAERLKRVLDEMGEPTTLAEAEAMIRFADQDRDGRVSRDDFMGVFEKIIAKSNRN